MKPNNYLKEIANLVPVKEKYTAIDLFAGCGGLALGFESTGFKTIGYEMDHDAVLTYKNNLSDGTEFMLSPGKHNKLIKDIINEFAPRFAPGATVVYIGDTGSKEDFFDNKFFQKYGFDINLKSKLPDVILYRDKKKWLYLIESVTSHGPVDGKRKIELEKIFNSKKLSNIFVTAFNDRASMRSYLADIAWESEVWVSSDPSHLIHFNGDKFMGPFE